MSRRSTVLAAGLPPQPPRSEHWRDLMLDAVIVAAALVARADGAPQAAARMAVLVEVRRAGLLATPPQRDVVAAFAAQSAALAHPAAARRIVSRSMDAFVGTCWADVIASIADRIAAPREPLATTPAVESIRRALGLAIADRC